MKKRNKNTKKQNCDQKLNTNRYPRNYQDQWISNSDLRWSFKQRKSEKKISLRRFNEKLFLSGKKYGNEGNEILEHLINVPMTAFAGQKYTKQREFAHELKNDNQKRTE